MVTCHSLSNSFAFSVSLNGLHLAQEIYVSHYHGLCFSGKSASKYHKRERERGTKIQTENVLAVLREITGFLFHPTLDKMANIVLTLEVTLVYIK